jgi:hypothetical protein
LQIVNAGRVDLEIDNISVDGAGASAFVIDPASATVGSELTEENNLTIGVTFTPTEVGDFGGNLVISSNDGAAPEATLPIVATGRAVPVPDIDAGSSTLDFGSALPGDRRQAFIDVKNLGEATLEVSTIELSGSGAFTILTPPGAAGGFDVAVGGSSPMVIEYAPTGIDGDTTILTLFSNDPDEPEVAVELVGNGGSEFEYPNAVIDCPTEVRPLSTVPLDGSASNDPMGGALTYLWTLTDRPDGAAGTLTGLASPEAELSVDISGEWEVQLRVTSEVGLTSAPAICRFDAVPENQVHVELYWDAPDADLDLHLVERGYTFYQSPGDCNWCNPSPDWGVAGESADDPLLALDVDHTVGYGPENIYIGEPANADYDVMVHYYRDDGAGDVNATVVVWLGGRKVRETSIQLEHDQLWNAGYVRWPEAVFVANSEEPTTAPRRDCSTAP